MATENDIQGSQVTEIPDLQPIEIPGRNMNPSIEDRVAEIETVLNIS